MNFNTGEWVAIGTFVMAIVGSIGRVILKQNLDSDTLERVEQEVRDIQVRKEILADQVGKHSTELAVLKESFRNIDKKLDEIKEKLK